MPTYKLKADAIKDHIVINKTVYYRNQNFSKNFYYSQKSIEELELEFVSDTPYCSPIIVSTGVTTGNKTLTVPDSNWRFDIHAVTDPSVTLTIGFNGDTTTTNMIYVSAESNNIILRNVSGRAIYNINITASGSGNYCVYCSRLEDSRLIDTSGE